MGSQGVQQPLSAPPSATSKGIHSVLRYTGIPPSWFTKRPKLPSRNWLIFIGVTSSLVGLYAYDRKKCKEIRKYYTSRVEDLAQQPMGSLELPRKVTVYTSKWPGDEDYTRSLRYFRKYVKPILIAAAIDYDVLSGRRHGDLARAIEDRIKAKRRIDEGLETPSPSPIPVPINLTREQNAERELQGGIIIIGRMTFKEYMEGLRCGWTGSPVKVDREEVLAHALAEDSHFDEVDVSDPSAGLDGEPIPTTSRLMSTENAQAFSPIKPFSVNSTPSTLGTTSNQLESPTSIPPQPPLLLVPFTNYIGFKLIPLMIYDFFNQRAKTEAGARAAYCLVKAHTRPLAEPEQEAHPAPLFSPDQTPAVSDLDFDRDAEKYYFSSLSSFLSDIEKARASYYDELPKRLATARALARGEREPTKDEQRSPPPSEVELKAERLQKEKRWRNDEQGWNIVSPDKEVAWDDRFKGIFKVFVDPPEEPGDATFNYQ